MSRYLVTDLWLKSHRIKLHSVVKARSKKHNYNWVEKLIVSGGLTILSNLTRTGDNKATTNLLSHTVVAEL